MLGTQPTCRANARPMIDSAIPINCVLCDRFRTAQPILRAAPRPGHERNLLSPPCGDLPVGRFVDRAVQPSLQKYFASVVGRNIPMSLVIPSHTEGRIAIVTDVGHGMRWTRQRFARDGIAGRVL